MDVRLCTAACSGVAACCVEAAGGVPPVIEQEKEQVIHLLLSVDMAPAKIDG